MSHIDFSTGPYMTPQNFMLLGITIRLVLKQQVALECK